MDKVQEGTQAVFMGPACLRSLRLGSFVEVWKSFAEHWVLKALASTLLWLFGAHVSTLWAVLGLVVIDTATGIWKAARSGLLSSRDALRWAPKLVVYWFLLAAGAFADKALPFPFALSMTASFLALTELISILENVAEMGWPIPSRLLKTLKIAQGAEEKKNG